MKIKIPEVGEINEKLPPTYKVKERLFLSVMQRDYIAICSTYEKDTTALVYFDGISDTPVSIQKFWSPEII
jgi:hypothetical protein